MHTQDHHGRLTTLQLVYYANHTATRPEAQSVTWDELCERFSAPQWSPCGSDCTGKDCIHKNGVAWSPVVMQGKRAKANVQSVHALVLDIDDVNGEDLRSIESRLAEYRYIIHETHTSRHKPDVYRVRIILALESPISGSDWPAAWRYAKERLDLPGLDESTKDASRLYYVPTRPEGSGYLYEAHEGRPLKLELFAEVVPLPQQTVNISLDTIKAEIRAHGKSLAQRETLEDKTRGRLLANIVNSKALAASGDRDNSINLACSLIAFCLPRGEVPTQAIVEIFRPSILAMDCEPEGPKHWLKKVASCWERAYSRRLKSDEEDDKTKQFFEDLAYSPDVEPPEDWKASLQYTKKGDVKGTLYNYGVIFEALGGEWRWNTIKLRAEALTGPFVGKDLESVAVDVAMWICGAFDVQCSVDNAQKIILWQARKNPFDPLADYLSGLTWDGVARIDTWLQDYCQADMGDDRYLSEVGAKFLIAMAARGLKPGCKCDTVLIFEGDEGMRKTSAFEVLGGEWFVTMDQRPGDRDAYMTLVGSWVVELAELESFRKSQATALKAFITGRNDKFRAPYMREVAEYPRRCVIVGTTNDDHYLQDGFTIRRFWPVRVGRIDTEALQRDRDQLFAEAVTRYRAGEKWWFEENDLLQRHVEDRQEEPPYVEQIRSWLPKRPPDQLLTSEAIAERVLLLEPSRVDKRVKMMIGHAMRFLGYRKTRESQGERRYYYSKRSQNEVIDG